MSTFIGNWTAERTSTSGTGPLILTGAALSSALRFAQTLQPGNVYYSIEDGDDREAGIGVFDGISTITRNDIHSTKVGSVYNGSNPNPIVLTGTAIVSCTLNARAFDDLLHKTLGQLSDVVFTAPQVDDIVSFNGTNWVNSTLTPLDITELANVITTAPQVGDHFEFDGAVWRNATQAAGVAPHVHDAADITTGVIGDAYISQSSVTQHQLAINITESQVTDLDKYTQAEVDERVHHAEETAIAFALTLGI